MTLAPIFNPSLCLCFGNSVAVAQLEVFLPSLGKLLREWRAGGGVLRPQRAGERTASARTASARTGAGASVARGVALDCASGYDDPLQALKDAREQLRGDGDRGDGRGCQS